VRESSDGPRSENTEISIRDGQDRPPTQDEFMAILQEGNVQTAVELHAKFTALEPDLVLFPEREMNIMGYSFLNRGMLEEAITVLRMNAETYPTSANCWDSLAEAYIAADDREHALECVDKVIEVLPEDPAITEDLEQVLRANAERYREMLSGD
jgi:tetratricopeptide (TPR) repeat protein